MTKQSPAEIKEEVKQDLVRPSTTSHAHLNLDRTLRQDPVSVNAIDGIEIPSGSTPKAGDSQAQNVLSEQVRPSTTTNTVLSRAIIKDELLR